MSRQTACVVLAICILVLAWILTTPAKREIDKGVKPHVPAKAEASNDKTPPVLAVITIAPANSIIEVNQTQQFSALCLDQLGNPIAGIITWNASDSSIGKVDANGLFTATGAGNVTVVATSGVVTGTAEVTIK